MTHPRHALDAAFHTPMRFSLMATLAARHSDEIDFATLRAHLDADDGALSKAASALQSAGYVRVTKGYAENRPRTWFSATAAGRGAFARHVAALQAIVAGDPDAGA